MYILRLHVLARHCQYSSKAPLITRRLSNFQNQVLRWLVQMLLRKSSNSCGIGECYWINEWEAMSSLRTATPENSSPSLMTLKSSFYHFTVTIQIIYCFTYNAHFSFTGGVFFLHSLNTTFSRSEAIPVPVWTPVLFLVLVLCFGYAPTPQYLLILDDLCVSINESCSYIGVWLAEITGIFLQSWWSILFGGQIVTFHLLLIHESLHTNRRSMTILSMFLHMKY